MEKIFHLQGNLGWNGTNKLNLKKIKYDNNNNYMHTYVHENTFILMYTHIYTPTHSKKICIYIYILKIAEFWENEKKI